MAKKLSLLLAAAAALAFAIPAMASASTGLTTVKSPGGTLVPKGTKLRQTSVGKITITTTKVGEIECSSFSVESEVTENSASGTAGVGVGEGTASTCNVGENAATISGIKLTSLSSSSSESGTGKASLEFVAHLPGSLTCTFTTAAGGTTVTYVPNAHITTYTKAPLVVSPAGCGKSTLDGSFTTENSGGLPVFIM